MSRWRGEPLFLSALACAVLPVGRASAGESLSQEYQMAFSDAESKTLRLDVVRWDDKEAVSREFGLGLSSLPAEGENRTAFLTRPGGDIMYGSAFHDYAVDQIGGALPRLQKLLHGEVPDAIDRELRDRGFLSVSGFWSKTYSPNLLLLRLVKGLETRTGELDDAMTLVRDEPGSTAGLQRLLQVLHSEMDSVLTAAR